MTAPDSTRRAALAALREGRVCIRSADRGYYAAEVRSSRPTRPLHYVDIRNGFATCTCGRDQPCAHVYAVRLVTGHAVSP